MRQRQIQANNFRLRSIDKARSKLSYPDLGDPDFFRSPSIEEKWQQLEQEQHNKQRLIMSLKGHLAAKKARINKILGDRPPDWDGSLRRPGTEPDYPLFSKGSKDSAPVALGGDTPADLTGGQQAPTSEKAQANAEAERSRQARALAEDIRAEIAKTFGPSLGATDVTTGEMLLALQKYVSNEDMLRGFGSEALKIYSVVSVVGLAIKLPGIFVAREAAKREAAKLVGAFGKAAPKLGQLSAAEVKGLGALSKKHGIPFRIMGSKAETAQGLKVRADPMLRRWLPKWRSDKWRSTGSDLDVWVDPKTVKKIGWKKGVKLARDIKKFYTGKSRGKTGLDLDLVGYSKKYTTKKDLYQLPSVSFDKAGRATAKPGWGSGGTPYWLPKTGSELGYFPVLN